MAQVDFSNPIDIIANALFNADPPGAATNADPPVAASADPPAEVLTADPPGTATTADLPGAAAKQTCQLTIIPSLAAHSISGPVRVSDRHYCGAYRSAALWCSRTEAPGRIFREASLSPIKTIKGRTRITKQPQTLSSLPRLSAQHLTRPLPPLRRSQTPTPLFLENQTQGTPQSVWHIAIGTGFFANPGLRYEPINHSGDPVVQPNPAATQRVSRRCRGLERDRLLGGPCQ
jgi:hypothetical protein